jgi:DNA-binding LacI/PurR family transcriptional regulator
MVTLKDVSKRAGVSPSAVSYILNKGPYVSEKTRAKVLKAIRELNYVPNGNARALRKKQTALKEAIGVLAGPALFSDPPGTWMSRILVGIEKEVHTLDYQLLLGSIRFEAETFELPRMLRERSIDGVVVLAMNRADMPQILEQVKKFHVPAMVVEYPGETQNLPSINIDNQKAAFDAVTHLLDEGYKAVAMVTGYPFVASVRGRVQGYKLAMVERGLAIREEWMVPGNFSEKESCEAAKRLLQILKPPFGIFVANDLMARGVMRGLTESGVKVPEDVGVIGFDDIADIVTSTTPELSSVHVPWETIGITAVKQLMPLLEVRKAPAAIPRILMPCELRIRGSSQRKNDREAPAVNPSAQ